MMNIPTSLVPMVIETTGRGERAFDIFSLLLRSLYITRCCCHAVAPCSKLVAGPLCLTLWRQGDLICRSNSFRSLFQSGHAHGQWHRQRQRAAHESFIRVAMPARRLCQGDTRCQIRRSCHG